ncbi:hypothetical protein HYH03_003712 [Edaphochlamys debaryana]|uniref:ABC1 atypical kinase-like domain-containing protein n=1 Tax=Edaphochlamys debaryana TaxID=47281 RepID=A0A835YBY9_9CHLO|nr:hypothetical protein HYH03_003712 [Edaphochlamys debaryana]|eukprot:KAG2498458.1 hypothetical protein HYH03_003712 [Edaphochlamys debaryana]
MAPASGTIDVGGPGTVRVRAAAASSSPTPSTSSPAGPAPNPATSSSASATVLAAAPRGPSPAALAATGKRPPAAPPLRPTSSLARGPGPGSAASQQQQRQQQARQQQQDKKAAADLAASSGWGGDDLGDIEIPEFKEPSAYNAAMNNRYWETRPVRVLARLLRIGAEFGSWAAVSKARSLRLQDPEAGEALAAESLKDVLVRLGPAFVKIGQALSSRPDVMPPAYITALEALQDRIPPFPDKAAMDVLELELGVPPSTVFARLSTSPVAAASLGQVYRGVLRPELGGAEVAVKVQRPRVAQMIAQDVYILRIVAGWLRAARRLNTDLPALVDEWASSLFRELDYRIESDNARRFKELFSHLPQVYVPHIYDEFTTAKVLTMEWIEGERLRTAGASATEAQARAGAAGGGGAGAGPTAPAPVMLDAQRLEDIALVEVGVRCSLEQMLEEGFYHADPHPGNLLRTPDGRLAYLDFGMMGSIDEKTRNALMTATLHLVNREYGRLAEDFVTLGLLPPGTDRTSVLPALTGVFSEALSGGVSNLSFGKLSGNLGATMYKYSFRIPPYYTLLVRSLSVLEGIALAADPNYKVLGSAYPWIARRLLTDPSDDLRVALLRLLYGDDGRFRFDRLESLLRQAAKSANRLKRPATPSPSGPAPTANGNGDGSAAVGTRSPAGTSDSGSGGGGGLRLLLSHDGEFVRGILLDEVAKGIDGAWRIAADAALASVRRNIAALPAPAVPLLALLPGAPLAVLALTLAARGAGGGALLAGGAAAGAALNPSAVQQSLVSALARLPSLANADDRAQVAGLAQLGSALADVSGLKLPPLPEPSDDDGTGFSLPGPLPLPAASPDEMVEAAQQAAQAVQWLAQEAAELPPDARGELLQLPIQLGSRLASRLTARGLRAAVLAGAPDPTAAPPAAAVVPPAGE